MKIQGTPQATTLHKDIIFSMMNSQFIWALNLDKYYIVGGGDCGLDEGTLEWPWNLSVLT